MQEQIQAMGSNMLFVGAGTVTRSGMHRGWDSTKSLIYDDMLAIMRECPAAHAAAPGSNTSGHVVFGNDNWVTRLNGTEPQYFDIRSWPFFEGSAFTQNDVEMSANVAVIGETVRKNLFGATDPIGQTIRINNLPFPGPAVPFPKETSLPRAIARTTLIWFHSPTFRKKLPA